MTLIYLVAGEASGDVLGARLIAALRAARSDLHFAGIGGPRMAEQGITSLFPMHDLAVMGFLEVLPRLRLLRRRMDEAAADITRLSPDAVVTIDAPGFTLRLLRRIRALPARRIHYVAPQIWAWRESRAKHYPGLWHDLLCLLPFEPAFFARHNLPAHFVGHPVLESGANHGDATRFRASHDIRPDEPILLVLPGSRAGELHRLLPIFAATIAELHRRITNLRPVLIAAPGMDTKLHEAARSWPHPPLVISTLADKHDAYAAASAALTKSGTSSLELALAGVPMAIAYRANPISAALFRHMTKLTHVSLVNLLPNQSVVPELLQHNCTPTLIANALTPLLLNQPEATTQRSHFTTILASLTPPSGTPSQAAATTILASLAGS